MGEVRRKRKRRKKSEGGGAARRLHQGNTASSKEPFFCRVDSTRDSQDKELGIMGI
jgi:hypothetical protein